MSDPSTRRDALLAGLLSLAIVVTAGITVARRSRTPIALQADFGAPSLMVRDCREMQHCYYQINPFGDATALGVQHGALFPDALLLASYLGEPLGIFRAGSELAGGLALLLFFLWGWRRLSLLQGVLLLGSSLLVWQLFCPSSTHSIWNPAMLPLPAFAFAAASASYLLERRLTDLLIATLAASVAAQAHAAAFVLTIALVYLLLGTRREDRAFHALATGLFYWGALQVGSPAMFTDVYFPQLPEGAGPGLWILAGALALVGLWLFVSLARRFREGELGLLVFLATTHLPFFLTARLIAPGEPRYAFSLVPGVALGLVVTVSLLLRLLYRRLPLQRLEAHRGLVSIAAVGLMSATVVAPTLDPSGITPQAQRLPPEAGEFTVGSTAALVDQLYSIPRLQFAQVFRHLRGGIQIKQALNGVALAFRPDRPDLAREEIGVDFAVFPLGGHSLPGTLPETWTWAGHSRSEGILLQTYLPFLDWNAFGLLLPSSDPKLEARWWRIDYRFAPDNHPMDRNLLASRSDPGIMVFLYGLKSAERLLIRVPLTLPAWTPPRLIALPPGPLYGREPSGCQGAILSVEGMEGVEGLDLAAALPARQLLLPRSPTEHRGFLTVAWDLSGPNCPWATDGLPPPILELEAEDARLLASVYPDSELAALASAFDAPAHLEEAPARLADLIVAATALQESALDRGKALDELEPWPESTPRTKEPLTGPGVKLASIAALWLPFLLGLGVLLRRRTD